MATDLQRFLDAKKTSTRLLGDVERYILKRPREKRRTDVLHPSEIIKSDWCMRYSYYLLNGGEPKIEKPGLRLQNIFDEGHAIHHKWQKRFQEMGVLYGKWHSPKDESDIWATSSELKDDSYEYKEVPLKDDSLRLHGHSDGWIKGIGEDCLIEIKSIGAGTLRYEAPELLYEADGDVTKAWKNIRRPFRSHLLQGQVYLELAYRMFGDKAPKEIVFLYELKADQDYKEFTVKADFEIISRVFFMAEKLIKNVEDGIMPPCNISVEGCKLCNLIS